MKLNRSIQTTKLPHDVLRLKEDLAIITLLWVFLFMSVVLPVHGQNIKNEKVDVKYLQLPNSPLRKELKTYRKTVELISLSAADSREGLAKTIASNIILHGYQEVQDGADFEVYTRLEGYAVEGSRVDSQERTETKSDKTTVTYRAYTGVCNIVYPLFLRLRDLKEDKIIFEGYINGSDRYREQQTGEFRDHSSAKAMLQTLAVEGKGKLLEQNLYALRVKMINDYSYFPTRFRMSINYVETSKKANYDDVIAARDATKAALESLPDNSIDLSTESREKMLAAIEKWESILKESNMDDRKARIDRKVSQAIQENIAYCHLFIHNFSEAYKIAGQSREINKQQWQYDLEQRVSDMKKRFTANNMTFK